jgi:DNA-binding MarR family transcriptional regulator
VKSRPPATVDVIDAVARETGFLLQRAHRRMRAAIAEALLPLELGVGHFGILALLFTREGLSQQQLIEILEIDKSSMVYLIDELEKQGLAERRPAPADRRAYAVYLTPQGRERVIQAGQIVGRVQSEFLSSLKPRERDQLNKLLRRIAV